MADREKRIRVCTNCARCSISALSFIVSCDKDNRVISDPDNEGCLYFEEVDVDE